MGSVAILYSMDTILESFSYNHNNNNNYNYNNNLN
jgi:hypothetical protein